MLLHMLQSIGYPPLSLRLVPFRQGLSLNLELMFFQLGWQPTGHSRPPVSTALGAGVTGTMPGFHMRAEI